jgi:hypothetical protein
MIFFPLAATGSAFLWRLALLSLMIKVELDCMHDESLGLLHS